MFCPKCGKMNPDDRENCSGCGAVLHEPKDETPKKKNGAAGKIIALVAALAVAAGGVAFGVSSCSKDAGPAAQTESGYITLIY